MIEMFKHNDVKSLERKLREVLSNGQPRTHRPWKKILVVVEGLYSMEGSMVNLPGILALKRKYKFSLFVDEAHSIGALGPNGRGVCDYFGVDPSEVDILMGTLTKSFGANGGYIAGDKALIDKLRVTNAGTIFGESPTPSILAQITSSLRIITGELVPGQGEERLQRLAFNSRYLRLGLKRLGFIVYGNDDSPIIPLMLYNPAKIPAFSHEMLARKISVVVVGYPATPLVTSRARFCVSAAHTKDDLDRLLGACDRVGDILQLKFSSGIAGGALPLPEGVTPEMEQEWIRNEKVNGQEMVRQPPRWSLSEVIKRGAEDKLPRLQPKGDELTDAAGWVFASGAAPRSFNKPWTPSSCIATPDVANVDGSEGSWLYQTSNYQPLSLAAARVLYPLHPAAASSCNVLPTISGNTSILPMEGESSDSSKPQLLQPGRRHTPARAAACICTGEDR
ncbi:MAG: hypothetical protein Q9177_002071 [Variospora cf. flavescens]